MSDYQDLRAAVIRLLGSASYVEHLDVNTRSAEAWLSRNLRHANQIAKVTLTYTGGEALLPLDYKEALYVLGADGGKIFQGPLSLIQAQGSEQRYFAVDATKIYIRNFTGPRDLVYYAALPTVTGSLVDTSWCLVKYIELYTYATAYAACEASGDVEKGTLLRQVRDQLLLEAKIDTERAQFGVAVVQIGGTIV